MKKAIRDSELNNYANIMRIQKHQADSTSNRLSELASDLDKLDEENEDMNNQLDDLLLLAEEIMKESGLEYDNFSDEDQVRGQALLGTLEAEKHEVDNRYKEIETISIDQTTSWDEYLTKVELYSKKYAIDLRRDPFEELLSPDERSALAKRIKDDYMMMKRANCDKYDYMIGAFSGVVAGLIDSFFVGMPTESKLEKWTIDQTDKFVIKVAQGLGYKPKGSGEPEISKVIKWLEDEFKVNYDQATGKAASDLLGMSMSNHHIKSIAHSPSLIGLIFSIIDQFTGTSHFLDNGRLITFSTKKQKLVGSNFISKLYSGICNWAGHLLSDVAGSYSSRSKSSNSGGSGIPMPLFELFQLIGKGKFIVYQGKDKSNKYEEMTLADLSVRVFEEGYDFRFGLAQAIPVVINELMIRFLWALKSRFVDGLPWKECIPLGSNPNLRRVLLTGHGVLCLVDGIDAGLRSQGQVLRFALHLNFVAWKRLAFAGLMEVRAIYKENAIDLNKLEDDLKKEWDIL